MSSAPYPTPNDPGCADAIDGTVPCDNITPPIQLKLLLKFIKNSQDAAVVAPAGTYVYGIAAACQAKGKTVNEWKPERGRQRAPVRRSSIVRFHKRAQSESFG